MIHLDLSLKNLYVDVTLVPETYFNNLHVMILMMVEHFAPPPPFYFLTSYTIIEKKSGCIMQI